MSSVILDTNIVSFLMNEDPLAQEYRWILNGHHLAISFMTVAELYHGAYKARWGIKRLLNLDKVVTQDYLVLFPDTDVCRRWGEVRHERRAQRISGSDAWIAATSLTYKCPLITHNPKHFRGIRGLEIITAES